MSDISKLTKEEMVNYFYVKDVIRGGDNTEYINKINYIEMMGNALPFILVLILILLIFLVYKQYYKKDIKSKEE